MFEHVGSSHMNASQHEGSGPANGIDKLDDFQRAGSALLAQQGAANAALRLLDDLCMMATGGSLSVLTSASGDVLAFFASLTRPCLSCSKRGHAEMAESSIPSESVCA